MSYQCWLSIFQTQFFLNYSTSTHVSPFQEMDAPVFCFLDSKMKKLRVLRPWQSTVKTLQESWITVIIMAATIEMFQSKRCYEVHSLMLCGPFSSCCLLCKMSHSNTPPPTHSEGNFKVTMVTFCVHIYKHTILKGKQNKKKNLTQ